MMLLLISLWRPQLPPLACPYPASASGCHAQDAYGTTLEVSYNLEYNSTFSPADISRFQQKSPGFNNLRTTTLSDSPLKDIPVPDKETESSVPTHSDVENGDAGIVVHAAPLARKLKGRHMQMIAIGKLPHLASSSRS
jgi:hypothetical protein